MKKYLLKNRTFIIAEAGVNHNGDVKLAKRLIDVAKEAGADAIKFQTFQAKQLVSMNAPKSKYQLKSTSKKESQYFMLKKLELTEKEHKILADYCKEKKIMFISSPFDDQSLDLLLKLGVGIIKIPSGEVTNFPFLKTIAKAGRDIILSTGMSTLAEVKAAIQAIYKEGNRKVVLLHCVTEYPAAMEDVNLKAMLTMRDAFQVGVGYSDHTLGVEIPIAAVALGAIVIEKHLTLDKNMKGPDHRSSLEPKDFADMVKAIRNVEVAIGDGIKQPSKSEIENRNIIRKSLIAKKEILKGQVITENVIDIKRPGYGVQPKDINKVLGRTVLCDIKRDAVIEWTHIQ